MHQECDVAIIGGGVTGTALLAALTSRHAYAGRVVLIEKNARVAEVNSHPLNNAQTSHDGGTETNYNLRHALEVRDAAMLLRGYIDRRNAEGLSKKTTRMVLAVGAQEVAQLESRYAKFKDYYPDLRLVYGDELAIIEPKVMEGRDPKEKVAALVSSEGVAVNYQRLAECFVEDAQASENKPDLFFNTDLKKVRKEDGWFILETDRGEFRARVVVFAAGAYSLFFAQKLGYGLEYGILSVAGSFFSGGKLLNGKVYRMQIEGMPFAAIHGDPDVLNQDDTRFGPTTKPLALMERYHYDTFWDYIKLPTASPKGVQILLNLLIKNRWVGYVTRNALYDVPVLGVFMFLQQARVIVPTIRYKDLKLRRGVGGVRPQIVNMKTGNLEMGDKTLVGENCIFNTTPSPGASVCLANAERDAARVVEFLGEGFYFDREGFREELGVEEIPTLVG